MKLLKKVVSVVTCMTLCLLITTNVQAALGEEMVGNSSENQTYATPRGTYLSYGTSGISDAGNGLVIISGRTICNRVSSTVEVTSYLERLMNGTWTSVTYRSGVSYNSGSAACSDTLSVSRGYYYRVRSAHVAVSGSVRETTVSYTDGLYIG